MNNKYINKKNTVIISIVIILLVIGAVGYYYYGQKVTNNTVNPAKATANTSSGRGNNSNFSVVRGSVSSITDKTAIIDSSDNQGQRIVQLSDTTNIIKDDAASQQDVLKVGTNVLLSTDTNALTVKSVTIPLQNNRRPNPSNTMMRRGNGAGQGQLRLNSNTDKSTFIGKIDQISDTSITLTTQDDNQQHNFTLQSSTKFYIQTKGTVSDIKTGNLVIVSGTSSTNGSIVARNIQLTSN